VLPFPLRASRCTLYSAKEELGRLYDRCGVQVHPASGAAGPGKWSSASSTHLTTPLFREKFAVSPFIFSWRNLKKELGFCGNFSSILTFFFFFSVTQDSDERLSSILSQHIKTFFMSQTSGRSTATGPTTEVEDFSPQPATITGTGSAASPVPQSPAQAETPQTGEPVRSGAASRRSGNSNALGDRPDELCTSVADCTVHDEPEQSVPSFDSIGSGDSSKRCSNDTCDCRSYTKRFDMIDRQLKELKDNMKEMKDEMKDNMKDMIAALSDSLPQQLYNWNRQQQQQQQAQSAQSSEGAQRTA
jgi:hypothetical protein